MAIQGTSGKAFSQVATLARKISQSNQDINARTTPKTSKSIVHSVQVNNGKSPPRVMKSSGVDTFV